MPRLKRADVAVISDKKLYLSKRGLGTVLGVTARQVDNYLKFKNPLLPDKEQSTSNLYYFEIWKSLSWYKENITHLTSDNQRGKGSSMLSADTSDEENPYADVDLDNVPQSEAERRKAIEAVKKLQMQNKILDGENISIDQTDRNMATQAATHISHLTNSEKILPDLLENKSASDIQEILNDHNQSQIEQLHRLVNIPLSGEHELYDVFNILLEKLDAGVDIETLFDRVDKITTSKAS